MVYALSAIKGVSWHSTIAEHLTAWLAKRRDNVLLVDAGERATASDFTAWREPFEGEAGYTLV